MKLCLRLLVVLSLVVVPFISRGADAAGGGPLTGTWDAVVETPQGSGTPVLVLKQDGQKVSGRYQGTLGDAPITGTVRGNEFTLAFKSGEGTKIEYVGVVEGVTLKGRAKFGGEGEGSFTARKRDGK